MEEEILKNTQENTCAEQEPCVQRDEKDEVHTPCEKDLVKIQCPCCEQSYTIERETLGGEAVCESCGMEFILRLPDEKTKPSRPETGSHPEPDEHGVRQMDSHDAPKKEIKKMRDCPYCGESIFISAKKCKHCGEFIDVDLRKENEARKAQPTNNPINQVLAFVRWFTDLPRLSGFKFSGLFSSAFKRHTQSEIDALFCSGGIETTPAGEDVSSAWHKPWVCWRVLFFGLIITGAFVFAYEEYKHPFMLPGIMILGAFAIPLAVLLFFYEMNVLRNVSFYKTLSCVITGGIISLIITTIIYNTSGGDGLDFFLGPMSAGIIEEAAKFIVAIIVVFTISGTKWTLQGMLVGAAIGVGFAGFETAEYGFYDLYKFGLDEFYDTMMTRGIFSPFCHVVWTALSAGALYGEIGGKTFSIGMIFKWNVVRILLFSITLHMLWNSGMLWSKDTIIKIIAWLLSIVGSWQAVLMMIQKGLNEIKDAQAQTTMQNSAPTEEAVGLGG
jgi:Predicted membrane protein